MLGNRNLADRRKITVKSQEMGGELVSKTFPEEVVEKIIARMPFPSLFKARSLSKLWLARLSAISSLDSNEEKLLATSFQEEVAQYWSHNWQIFGLVNTNRKDQIVYNPVWQKYEVSRKCSVRLGSNDMMDRIGYDPVNQLYQASQKWGRLPPLFILPGHFGGDLQVQGALAYWTRGRSDRLARFKCNAGLYVANILTREWKKLPPLPDSCPGTVHCLKLVSNSSSGTYKMIMVCQSDHLQSYNHCSIHIYDSAAGTWSCKVCLFSGGREYEINSETSALFHGVLYMVSVYRGVRPWDFLLAFNVEEETLEEVGFRQAGAVKLPLLPGPHDDGYARSHRVRLVVWNANLLMVGVRSSAFWTLGTLKFDLKSGRFREACQCVVISWTPSQVDVIGIPCGEVNCIFYENISSGGAIMVDNEGNGLWSLFPLPGSFHLRILLCQLALNAFMAV